MQQSLKKRLYKKHFTVNSGFQLHLTLSDPLTYNVVLDKLLIAKKNLLPSQDGGLGPGVKGSGARVRSGQHLFLGGFGHTRDHLVGSLQRKRERNSY